MKDALAGRAIDGRLVLALVGLLMLLVAPHAGNLSLWIVGFFLVAGAWRLAALRAPRLLPPRWTMVLLMLLGIVNVVMHAGVADGRLAGTALLIVMLGLKLLELRSRRDVVVCVFLGFFVVMTQFLYSNSLGLALYLLLLTTALTSLLIALNRVHPDLRHTLLTTLVLLLSAVPLAVLLFLVFPRLDNPLWAMQIDSGKARTGISDHMSMGTIGQLSQSGATAFHVRFQGEPPAPQDRYWRGIVLTRFDGVTWEVAHSSARAEELHVDPGSRVDYEVTMEPSGKVWLFPLEMPAEADEDTYFNRDYQLVSRNQIDKRRNHAFTSYTRYRALGLEHRLRLLNLDLPASLDPRVHTLAQQWRTVHPRDDAAVVDAALALFNQQPFEYTLTPGQAVGDPVAHFLFESRRGFCEHFAGSFTVLMRAAGIPARVVVGYQGGQYNPHGELWTIRQSDAHAWSEVWLGERGWVRVDPTAAVAPERIRRGIDPARSEAGGQVVFEGDSLNLFGWMAREAGWLIDATDLGWHRWVLGFSKVRQQSLLQQLGLDDRQAWLQGVGVLAALALGTLVAYIAGTLRSRASSDPVQRDWKRLLLQLRRAGLAIPAWAGPQQVLRLAAGRWPLQRDRLEQLVRLYVQQRYGRQPRRERQRTFQRELRALRLR